MSRLVICLVLTPMVRVLNLSGPSNLRDQPRDPEDTNSQALQGSYLPFPCRVTPSLISP